MTKRIYSLKDSTILKIDTLSINMGLNKSEFVDLVVDSFDNDFDIKIAKLTAKKQVIDIELAEMQQIKTREQALIDSLVDQKEIYKENIKRKWDEGDVINAVEIAKRVSRLLRCNYLELLPVS